MSSPRSGARGLTDFMFDLPSSVPMLELMGRQHAHLQTKWKPNDLNDLVYLSVSIAYCDIVVTERRWSAMLAQIDVHSRTGTIVLGKLTELPAALEAPDPPDAIVRPRACLRLRSAGLKLVIALST
jgi:hypothetical protein